MSSLKREMEVDTAQVRGDICPFIPEYVLEAVAQSSSGKLDDLCRSCAKNSISTTQSYHENRDRPSLKVSHSRYLFGAQIYMKIGSSLCLPWEKFDQSQQILAATTTVTATKRIIHDCAQSDSLPGRLVRSEGQDRIEDRSVNNCYDGFGIVLNFFREVLGRNSLDDRGMDLIASCHYRENGLPLNNAFWTSAHKQVIFGDGDGVVFDYLTDSLDIIAHELTHGLIDYTAQFEFFGQSGALDESYADIFACMIEQWHQSVTVDQADWIIGQTMFPVAFRGVGMRSVKSPGSAYKNHEVLKDDVQVKHMDNLYKGSHDRYGVHINSGIPNYAFYLAAKEVGGFSWEKVGRVWYRILLEPRDKIPMRCDFKQFAELTLEVASRIFSNDLLVRKAINNAWVAVGVLRE